MKILIAFLSIWSSLAWAADRTVPCTGASCNILLQPRNGGGVSTPVLKATSSGVQVTGNLGIGTSAPAGALDVAGTICLSGANCISSWPGGSGSWTTLGSDIYNANAGNVGIGTTAPLNRLDVVGSLALGAYAGTSSAPTNSLIVSSNIGIGTTTPIHKLHIDNGQAPGGGVTTWANTVLSGAGINNALAIVDGTHAAYFSSDATGGGSAQISTYDYGASAGFPMFFNSNGGNVSFGPGGNAANQATIQGNMSVGTGYNATAAPANGLIVEGNVGIGTITPVSALQVNGTITTTAISAPSAGPLALNGGGGYVGIGTAAPGYLFDVDVGANSIAQRLVGSGVDSPTIRFENTSGKTYHVGSTASGSGAGYGFSIYDLTGGAPRFLVESSGNVGIGTITPAGKLDVAGTICLSASCLSSWPTFNSLSPMTTAGDLIYGGVAGVATRLPVGANNSVLTVVAGSPAWATVTSGPNPAVFFGDGSSGDFNCTGATTLSGPAYYHNLTLSSGCVLTEAGYPIFVSGILDLTSCPANSIVWPGANGPNGGSGIPAQGASPASGSTPKQFGVGSVSSTAGNGQTTNGSSAASAGTLTTLALGNGGATSLVAGAGGAGGVGSGGAGGPGTTATTSYPIRRWFTDELRGTSLISSGQAGPSGGGGGGDSVNRGGGAGAGGNGGNNIGISAAIIKRGGGAAGCINARGGSGGDGKLAFRTHLTRKAY